MATPNIVNVTTIVGKTAVANVTTVSSNIVVNTADSSKVLKINSLLISNYDPTVNSTNISASIFRNSASNHVANGIPVPAAATMVLISKDMSLYLEEGDALRVSASANNDLWAICSYEEIS